MPKLALVQADGTVILNGGKDRGVQPYATYEVLERGLPIYDPDNGDVIGHQPGRNIGRMMVNEIKPRFSVGGIVTGRVAEFQVGQSCRRCAEATGGSLSSR